MPGIYIHIPFCKQACHYCNFHFSTSLAQKEKLLDAIVEEIHISQQQRTGKHEIISSLYFGGGTPSMLSIAELGFIFEALHRHFIFAADAEITLEANPDDISEVTLKSWRQLGINRFSVGIQSFLEKELIWMNRAHSAAESLICIEQIRDAGFSNFSVDLIYGSPVLADDDWKRNVEIVVEKKIPHISCYALTVEPKTALDKMIVQQKKEPVDTEKQARQFLLLMDWMHSCGYEHYEISNFAKPGFRSRHNSSYWSGDTYYGFGPSAHAYDGKRRTWNIANNSLYIQSLQKGIIPFEEEVLTTTEQLNEYIMTSLRTMEGLDLDHVLQCFGETEAMRLQTAGNRFKEAGKLVFANRSIVLTKEGKLFADGIAADLFA